SKLALTEKNITTVSCKGLRDGSISLGASGGYSPYTFQINNGIRQQDSLFSELGAGSYIINLTDSKGCSDNTTLNVSEPDSLTFTYSLNPVTCYGEGNGSISAVVIG